MMLHVRSFSVDPPIILQKGENKTQLFPHLYLTFHAVIPVLVALRADKGMWPPYASMMLIELYSTGSGFSVRIVYNGEVIQLPFCDSTGAGLCDYNKFFSYMATVTPNSKTNCSPETQKQRRWKWY